MNEILKLDDSYIEKMAKFYTSDLAVVLYPSIREIPFYQWLQYELKKKHKGVVL